MLVGLSKWLFIYLKTFETSQCNTIYYVYRSGATRLVVMFQGSCANNSAQGPNMIQAPEQLEESTPTNVHRRQICLIRRLYYQLINLSLHS